MKWQESRFPHFLTAILKLLKNRAADQGALRLSLDEPQALGRLTLEDAGGTLLCFLIDSIKTREKIFFLPAGLARNGLILKNEAGETLAVCQTAALQTIRGESASASPAMPPVSPPSGPAAASGAGSVPPLPAKEQETGEEPPAQGNAPEIHASSKETSKKGVDQDDSEP